MFFIHQAFQLMPQHLIASDKSFPPLEYLLLSISTYIASGYIMYCAKLITKNRNQYDALLFLPFMYHIRKNNLSECSTYFYVTKDSLNPVLPCVFHSPVHEPLFPSDMHCLYDQHNPFGFTPSCLYLTNK